MNPSAARSPEQHPSPVERMLAGIDPDDVPTAGVDPIDSRSEAIAAVSLVVSRPLRAETVVLTLDAEHRGVGISRDPTERVVIITVDPTGSTPHHRPDQLDRLCEGAGVELLDWLALGPDTVTPIVGDRWPRSVSAVQPE